MERVLIIASLNDLDITPNIERFMRTGASRPAPCRGTARCAWRRRAARAPPAINRSKADVKSWLTSMEEMKPKTLQNRFLSLFEPIVKSTLLSWKASYSFN
jgi:hypothetical protein